MATQANPFAPAAKDTPEWMGVKSPYAKAFEQLSAGSQASAQQASFDEAKGAAGRVAEITSKDSPLMQRAQGRAAQAMNARGLSNSSMAVGAAETSVIDAATPLAQTDAQLYQQTQIENARLGTQASLQNAQLRTQAGMKFLDTTENGRQFDATLGQRKDEFGKTFGLETDKFNESKSQFGQSLGLERDKLAENRNQFQANLALNTRKVDMDEQQFAKSLGLEYEKLSEAEKSELRRLEFENKRLAEQSSQFKTEQDGLNSRFGKELDQKATQFKESEANQAARLKTELDSRERLSKLDNDTRLTVANLDASSREKVATLENNWRIELSRNDKLAGAWGTMMESINKLQMNKDIDPTTRQQLIQQNMDFFAGYANFSKKIGDNPIDVSDLLDFQTATGGGASDGSNTGNAGGGGGGGGGSGGAAGGGGGGSGGGGGAGPGGGFGDRDNDPPTQEIIDGLWEQDDSGRWRRTRN